jgi:hypothetical protein
MGNFAKQFSQNAFNLKKYRNSHALIIGQKQIRTTEKNCEVGIFSLLCFLGVSLRKKGGGGAVAK